MGKQRFKIISWIFAIAILLAISFSAIAQDYSLHKELAMKNEGGGLIVITVEPCTIQEAISAGFVYRAYATEGDGEKHEGCWTSPDTSDAPRQQGIRIVPVVNSWWDGEIATFLQNEFKPKELI